MALISENVKIPTTPENLHDGTSSSNEPKKVPKRKCITGRMAAIVKFLLYGFGSVFLILGFAITGFWKPLYHHLLASNLALTNGSQTKEMWTKNEVPIYFRVYLFNWTNPIETLSGEKADFVENGPYTFRFSQLKENLVWHQNHTVSYRGRREWEFVPEMSNGSLSDVITSVNVVAVALGDQAKILKQPDLFIVNKFIAFNEKQLFVRKTAKELLFEGYHDKILDVAKIMKKYFKKLSYMTDKFGWYFGKNETQVDLYNIHTGTDDINNLGKLHSWNYKTECNIYTKNCDKVRGSLGDLWPMNIGEEKIASIFISDLCGAFDLTNVGNKEVYDVEGTHFVGNERTFDNGTAYPENSCYCRNNQCNIPSGVRNVADCLQAPIYISFPHFYTADKSYRENINGMKPDPEKHTFSLTMQKDSGIIMEIFARLQINVKVEPYPGLPFFSELPNMIFPALWFEEYVDMPDKLKQQLKFNFNQVPNLLSASGFIFVIVGTVLLVFGFFVTRMSYTEVPYTQSNL